MPRRPLINACALLGVLAVAGCGSSSTSTSTSSKPAPAAPAAPTTSAGSGALAIAADPSGQLAFDKKSASAKSGTVKITFTNSSPVPHNLTLTDSSGKTLGATPTFSGGGSKALSVKLAPGTYTYYCSVPGHRDGGMQGTLTVS